QWQSKKELSDFAAIAAHRCDLRVKPKKLFYMCELLAASISSSRAGKLLSQIERNCPTYPSKKDNLSGDFFTLKFKPISYRILKHINIDVLQRFEFYAIPGHTCLPEFLSIGFSQVCFISKSHDIHRNSRRVCTQTNLIKLPRFPVSIFYC